MVLLFNWLVEFKMYYKKAVLDLEDFPASRIIILQEFKETYCEEYYRIEYVEEGEALLKLEIKGITTEYLTLKQALPILKQLIKEYEKENDQKFNETAKEYLQSYIDYAMINATMKGA